MCDIRFFKRAYLEQQADAEIARNRRILWTIRYM